VTIGNFDGVHLGHLQIIQLARSEAQARRGKFVAYTFRPHPQIALRPNAAPSLLSTYDEKIELLAAQGVDWVIEEPFSREFSAIEPETFFREVLLGRLGAEVIVVGYDFAFGKERHGHLELLRDLCKNAGVRLIVVDPQKVNSEIVSSSRIRQYLLAGQIEAANRLLGRPFSYQGVVIRGKGRGKKLGIPTANLKLQNKLALPYGVYATWAEWNGKKIPSVTNVGVRPTFEEKTHELPVWVETHLLDTTEDLYGSVLKIEFLTRLREEKKFSDVNELIRQIHADIANAKVLFGHSIDK
jgi:riboflavin kinase/FMN adenylyltransferase